MAPDDHPRLAVVLSPAEKGMALVSAVERLGDGLIAVVLPQEPADDDVAEL